MSTKRGNRIVRVIDDATMLDDYTVYDASGVVVAVVAVPMGTRFDDVLARLDSLGV